MKYMNEKWEWTINIIFLSSYIGIDDVKFLFTIFEWTQNGHKWSGPSIAENAFWRGRNCFFEHAIWNDGDQNLK